MNPLQQIVVHFAFAANNSPAPHVSYSYFGDDVSCPDSGHSLADGMSSVLGDNLRLHYLFGSEAEESWSPMSGVVGDPIRGLNVYLSSEKPTGSVDIME